MRSLSKILLVVLLGFGVAACETLSGNSDDNLKGSGVVEAVEVSVASELGGRIAEVLIAEGDRVRVGDQLFTLEDELLEAQRDQVLAAREAAKANKVVAESALKSAEAALEAAEAGVEAASIHYELELVAARLLEAPARIAAWDRDIPREFSLPVWYFEKSERIAAAEAEIEAAEKALEIERQNFEKVIEEASNADLQRAEIRLSEAQVAFLVADALADRKIDWRDREEMDDFVDTIMDAAEAELEDAQKDYDKLLTDQASDEVLEARARLAVSQERYETAMDMLDQNLTGEESLRVRAAEVALRQAEAFAVQAEVGIEQASAAVMQAEKGVDQAQAALDLVDVQIGKLTVSSAVSGVVMARNIEPGEVIAPGVIAMTIGELDHLTITVYIPEDRYGQINLGDSANVTVDSFPEITFEGVVTRIADQAEFTPRNVQTEEDRKTTVFAVELSVGDSGGKLKPGMPADVVFGE